MPNKIAILHFNIIEKYPPVMNFIFDAFEENPTQEILVFTTKNNTSYTTPHFPNTKIYRFGTLSANPIIRYTSYLWFNLMSSIVLLLNRIDKITVFETLSIFPFWIVSKMLRIKKGHIHFHEYMSEPERIASSVYMKVLFKLENQLLKKYPCSQTNEDRKRLFLIDKPFLKSEMVEVRPNMPPKSWWKNYGKFKKQSSYAKIKLVYIGACNMQTMYVKEVLDWVNSNRHNLELTIFSQELDKETENLILSYNCKSINLLQPVDYYDLPKEIIKFDIGLVLYNGHIPNYVYNVPNKVYEYLCCGLQVIVDQKLITTLRLGIEQIHVVDYSSLDLKSIKKSISNVAIKISDYSQLEKLVYNHE
jgi:hypothetical protein